MIDNIKNCADVESLPQGTQSMVVNNLGSVVLGDLPSNIIAAVKNLAIGRFSLPIRSATSVMILMVCAREKIKVRGFNRGTIESNLIQRRFTILAQRYLRDLRRSAVVELR